MHRTNFVSAKAGLRAATMLGIVALGLISIVGSGGGGGFGLPSDCPPGWDCTTLPAPVPLVQPDYVTAQVGTPVTFSVIGSNYSAAALTYQWYRSSDGGAHYVAIAGATTDTLTLASVNLADDGAIYQVSAANVNGLSGSAMGRLAVSPGPAVIFADGEFPAAGWVAAPLVDGKTAAPTHSEETLATGGHPGAYRKMVVQFPPQTFAAALGYTSTAASYEPRTQGAILVIDYAEDGFAPQPLSVQSTSSALLLEQGGRRYIATTRNSYDRLITVWDVSQKTPSLHAADFRLYDGPVCQAGESCPDFSSSGAPMRFGYWRISSGSPGVSVNHGIDNWKVTVWKR
jgi:hypothetical protein